MLKFILNKNNIGITLLMLILFVTAYNVIHVGISYYILAFCVLSVFVVPLGRYIDNTSICLILFSIFYSLAAFIKGSYTQIPLYLLAPFAFYAFGNYICVKLESKKMIVDFLAILIFIFALFTYVISIEDILHNGLINPMRFLSRSEGDDALAATLYGLNVSLGLCGFAIFFLLQKQERSAITLLYFICGLCSLLAVIHLVNRTGLVILALSSLAIVLYIFSRQSSQKKLWYFIVIATIIILIINLGESSNISEAYASRQKVEDSGTFGDRGWRWLDAITNVILNPLGWSSNEYTYIHNLWLDVAKSSGILPFTFLLLATFSSLRKTLSLYKFKNNSLIIVIIGLNVSFLLTSFVEPVIEGCALYFYLMCMLWGIQNKYSLLLKQKTL